MPKSKTPMLIRTVSVLALATSAIVAAPAVAQDNTSGDPAEIVVTGSNIRNQDFKSTSPVQTVDKLLIANTAAVTLQDLFKGLSANAGSQQANEQNALQGVSQFSLRGLGVGSTLTLVNGHRAGLSPVTDGTGQLFTDSNAFPVNAIERIDVLTDGASATYGSEAVAGVVNIITRKKFEGIELTGDARRSVVDSYQLGAALGHKFDRGHITAFVNYRKQGGAFRSEIDIIKQQDSANAAGIGALYSSGTGAPGRINRALPSGATYTLGSTTLADPDCVAGGGILASAASCTYPFIDQRRVIAKEERIQSLVQFDYELTDSLKVYSELSYSRNQIRDAIGGTVLNKTQLLGGFLVPASHPFNYFVANGATGIRYAGPAEFAANSALVAVPVIFRGRPIGAAGDGINAPDLTTTFTNFRAVGGFDYSLGEQWTLSGSYTYSKNRYTRSQPHDYDSALFQTALNNGVFNPFGTAISSPTLVGKDGKSVAGNTEAEINSFSFTILDTGKVVQQAAELVISGDTGIQLPGGDIAVAFGGQYRSVGYENIPDIRRQNGTNGRDEIEPAIPYSTQNVKAIFAEVVMPVTDRLNIQGALRYEDYGAKGGHTVDPKISAKFELTDFLAIRGSWGTSFQAPSIRQVAGSVGNATVSDLPNAGSFNVTVFTSGSNTLQSQSASNLNLGIILNTQFGLKLSADYFTYKYKNLILADGDAQFIVDEVKAGRLPASRIVRDSFGQLRQVFSQFLNRGSASAEGLDINFRYTPNLFTKAKISLDGNATIITKFKATDFAGLDGLGNIKGSRNFANAFGSVPNFKLNAGVTLDADPFTINLSGRYIGTYTDDQTKLPIKSQLTTDLRVAFDLERIIKTSGSSLTIGAINVFNVNPPALTGRPGYDNEVHDIRGRQLYVSLKFKY